jgi:predicted nuclease of predicted toxin-antitoxin system
MRFYLDENLSPEIATIARSLGADVIGAHEVGRLGISDREQLDFAAAENRCLVTCDETDLIRLTLEFQAANRDHTGLLVIRWQVSTPDFTRAVAALAACDRAHPGDVSVRDRLVET